MDVVVQKFSQIGEERDVSEIVQGERIGRLGNESGISVSNSEVACRRSGVH